MSLKATIEILIHFQNFRNVDLFHQGVYQLRATIQQRKMNINTKEQQMVKQAQPYMIRECATKKVDKASNKVSMFQTNRNTQDYIIQGSHLEDMEFWSKAFIVKYCDEDIDLNDGCVFRCEIDAYPQFDCSDYYFEVDLMFTELCTLTQENYKNERLKEYMKPVAKFESKINNVFSGIKEFVQIMFDEMHFCVLKATVHSLLIDFRFRQEGEQTFDQFLCSITKTFQKDLVDDFYAVYVKTLKSTHEMFVLYQKNIINGVMLDDQLKLQFSNTVLQLPVPGYSKREPNYNLQLSENCLTDAEDQKSQASFLQKQQQDVLISDYFNLLDPDDQADMCKSLILEINHLQQALFQVWYQFLDVFDSAFKEVMYNLELEYVVRVKERWGESIFQDIVEVQDLAQYTERKLGRKHREVAQQIRNKEYYQMLEPLSIEDLNLFPKAAIHPILFKEVFIKQDNRPQLSMLTGIHLVVLAHGYQGNSLDMRLWKNLLSTKYPNHIYLSMASNEDNTEQDIHYMGYRLAEEVKKWIKDWCPKDQLARMSFIGHSLGGLIIRAALPHLERYRDKMQTVMTLATPHLGFLLSSSKVVDTGLWVIKKWKKCICLNQLTMTDNKSFEGTCLYKLSQAQGFGWFRNVILVSSYQDSYSPFESARIQRSDKLSPDSIKGKAYNQMIDNILGQLRTDRIQRLDVSYEIVGKNFDSMIGRAAHIAFLDNTALVKLIIYSFEDLFN